MENLKKIQLFGDKVILRKDPNVVKLAHKRLCDSIESFGIHAMDTSDSRTHKIFGGSFGYIFK